jgi:hypothetical protein
LGEGDGKKWKAEPSLRKKLKAKSGNGELNQAGEKKLNQTAGKQCGRL